MNQHVSIESIFDPLRQASLDDVALAIGIIGAHIPTGHHLSMVLRCVELLRAPLLVGSSTEFRTFAVVFWAVSRAAPERIGTGLLATIVSKLLQRERAVGGPYALPTDTPDVVTNTFLLEALTIHDIAPDALKRWVERSSQNCSFSDACVMAFIFHCSDRIPPVLLERIRSEDHSAVSVREKVFRGAILGKDLCFDDSMGTDVVVEAMIISKGQCIETLSSPHADDIRSIVQGIEFEVSLWSAELQQAIRPSVDRVIRSASEDLLVQFLWTFFDALRFPRDDAFQRARQFAIAHAWMWISYTLIDDICDGDASVNQLPAAMMAFRRMQSALRIVEPESEAYRMWANTLFDRLDAANAWELTRARMDVIRRGWISMKNIPDFSNTKTLSDRAIALVLGPLGLISTHGASEEQQHFLVEAITSLLAARQIYDDLHDWERDARQGSWNAVSTMLVGRIAGKAPKMRLNRLIRNMKRTLADGAFLDILDQVDRHARHGRSCFEQLDDIVRFERMSTLCDTYIQFVQNDRETYRASINLVASVRGL